jgi:hypothetical protein
MTTSAIADSTLGRVMDKLQSYGSSLEGDSRLAILALLRSLEAGLTGNLEPAYYLSAIDPGIGKTLSVATFLRLWKEAGFMPLSSVLIGVSRLDEIETYLSHSGLGHDDIAVLTSDSVVNRLGICPAQHREARVMFTSQQMIESRTKDKSFSEADEFHYLDKPRVLRIWDESMKLAQPITLRVDDLGLIASPLRHSQPGFVAEVSRFQQALWNTKGGAVVQVPEKVAATAPRKKLPDTQLGKTVDALKRLGGRTATMVDTGSGDMRLAGSATPFPDDFAPVIILDASGRVRTTYSLWEQAVGNLQRLPAAVNDYGRLRVHLWERAVGKQAFADKGTRSDVIAAIADIINAAAAGDWLVISYKDYPLEDELAVAVTRRDQRLNFLTWGLHHGTNAFAHCNNVIIIGQLTYGKAAYTALASAACGGRPVPEGGEGGLMVGEHQHNLLQALTRASVRRSVNGIAGQCNAYVVMSPGNNARQSLDDTFPGCTIEPWSPRGPQASGRAGELITLLSKIVGPNGVKKKSLREGLGVNGPNFSKLLERPDVQSFMERNHLVQDRLSISSAAHFEPWPGGGWTLEASGLDDA